MQIRSSLVCKQSLGNQINILKNDPYSSEITQALNSNSEDLKRVYLKGGEGIMMEIDLFKDSSGNDILNEIKESGVSVNQMENLEDGISEVDIIYVTRVQEERFQDKNDANKYRGLLSLNQSIYTANCEPNTVIMHPLPRDSRSDANELDKDLYENPNLAIFRQADNGVVIRMAMFALVLGVEDKIEKTSKSVNWMVGLNN